LNRKALWALKKDSFRAKDRIDAEKMEELEREFPQITPGK
jgi:hypothetical protein